MSPMFPSLNRHCWNFLFFLDEEFNLLFFIDVRVELRSTFLSLTFFNLPQFFVYVILFYVLFMRRDT